MDSLSGLTKLAYEKGLLDKKKLPGGSASTPASLFPTGGDNVDISPGAALDYLKAQAADLKISLPGTIASALLQPVSDNVVSQEPLNALLTQFVNPAQTFLSSKSANSLSPEQMKSLQQEVVNLKEFIPTMMANTLLAPLMQSSGDSINSILQSMSGQLASLSSQVRQKIQV